MGIAMAASAGAQWSRPKFLDGVGIQQNLDKQIPLDAQFRDETGQTVPLRTYFGEKPVVLELVFFSCRSVCPKSMYESASALRRVSLEPGRDYNVLVVSFDPADTPQDAAEQKADYAEVFKRSSYNAGWHFLTGTQAEIKKLTDAVGFRFRYDDPTKQFVHASGIMVATPDGKLSRYFYGLQYAPQDLRMALVDASEHKIGSPVDYVLLFCFHYDPSQGRYTLAILNVLKLASIATLMALGGLIYYLMRNDKQRKPRGSWRELRNVG
jgi:protein SCO1/2